MKRDRYWSMPKNVKGGWWYANTGSIEIHVAATSAIVHTTIRIKRKALLEYIRRTRR